MFEDSYIDGFDDDGRSPAESEAHLEWHANTGVPVGTPGCPQDACHADPYDLSDEEAAAYAAELEREHLEHPPVPARPHTHTPCPDFPPTHDPDDLPF